MRKTLVAAGLLLLTPLLAACSNNTGTTAKQSPDEVIRAKLSHLPIKQVNPSPIEGMYEIQVGDQIAYADPSGRYVIHGGHLVDMDKKKDLTQARLEEINKVDWNILPLDKAIISGDANATRKLVVFTDPDCPYCRALEKVLKDVKDVKVYTFLLPLEQIHPFARAKSEAIWCSEDQHAMLQKVMIDEFTPEKANCATPIDDLANLAQQLGIHGTPALIAGDGRRLSGAPRDAEALMNWLDKK